MQTLHEYMMVTKAHEYLIAVAFLAAFALYWRIVNRKGRRRRLHDRSDRCQSQSR